MGYLFMGIFNFKRKPKAYPKQEWVGLTDKEKEEIWEYVRTNSWEDQFAPWYDRIFWAIEDKLKEKNTYYEN